MSDLAAALKKRAQQIAEQVTDEFVRRHPDWVERFGAEAVRRHGIHDAIFHLDFLAAAIQVDHPGAYGEYASWAAAMLAPRGIAPAFLAENLEQIRQQLGAQLDPDAVGQLDPYFRAAFDAIAALPTDAAAAAPSADLHTVARMYVQALLAGNRRAAVNVALEALDAGMTPLDLYVDVIQAGQYEIGRMWADNKLSVAGEHVATAISQLVLSTVYERIEMPSPTRGRALVTGVLGEQHQLGANMVADALEADGWHVRFLGTNTSHRDVLLVVEEFEPSLVAVSTTLLANLPSATDLIGQLKARAGVRVLAGGRAFASAGAGWANTGADAVADDLRSAIDTARAGG